MQANSGGSFHHGGVRQWLLWDLERTRLEKNVGKVHMWQWKWKLELLRKVGIPMSIEGLLMSRR